jgi:sarcosine/dimethylglycine N-methyltransferase
MSDRDAQTYYATGPDDLIEVVLAALDEAGRSTDPLDPDDLAALDEFHGLGRAATLTLAELARISADDRVLDVGAGIGGPARVLARHFGATVTAIDPTERFCGLGEELTRRAGLSEKVSFFRADGRQMPFDDGVFDLALTQAVWPSVEDKSALLAEIHRVLAPGGRLALFEALEGPAGGELDYPLPWADGPEQSFVISAAEVRRLASESGFAVLDWLQGPDLIVRIGAVAGSGADAMSSGVEGVDLSLLMPDFEARMAGVAGNIVAQRIELAMAVLVRE